MEFLPLPAGEGRGEGLTLQRNALTLSRRERELNISGDMDDSR